MIGKQKQSAHKHQVHYAILKIIPKKQRFQSFFKKKHMCIKISAAKYFDFINLITIAIINTAEINIKNSRKPKL